MNTALVEANCFGPISYFGPADLWWIALSLGVMTGVHGRFEPQHLRWSIPYAAWVGTWALLRYGGIPAATMYEYFRGWPADPVLWPVYALGAAVVAGPVLGLAWRRRDLRLEGC